MGLRRGRWIVRALFQRKGVYYLNVRDKRSGRVHRVSTKSTRLSSAERCIEPLLDELEAREQVLDATPTFEVAYAAYLEGKTLAETTRRVYENEAEIYARVFGGLPLNEITPVHAQKFVVSQRDNSARTRQLRFTALRGFFEWARKMRYVVDNPLSIAPKVSVGEQRKDHVLSVDEARTLVRVAGGRPIQVAVLVGLYSGLRRATIFKLGREDIGLDRIDVPASKMKAKRKHSVPLHPVLAEALRDVELPFAFHGQGLFRLVKKAGIPHSTWRSLRRTFASWIQPHASFYCLKTLLAHRLGSANDITGKYVEVPWEDQVAAIEKLPDLVGARASSPKGT